MARPLNRLSALVVTRLKEPGFYGDGGGLYLQITGERGRSWVFRYAADGKTRYMGLGPVGDLPLADARQRAAECRRLRLDGIDPIEARDARRYAARLEKARAITFRAAAGAYIDAHRAGWRNAVHAAQWTSTLTTYAYPVFGDLPVAAVDTALVTKVIEPLWTSRTETASRLRGRIESVLDWAATRGYRQGENPARWRGHLENLLPKRVKVAKVEHHPALPYAEIGAFMAELRARADVSSLALEFLILTATRTSETIGAAWSEFDLKAGLWTIPGERIKAGQEHRVPLSGAAAAVLSRMDVVRADGQAHVFPGGKAGQPLSNMALLSLLKRMGRSDLTSHGFRSTFRDWAAERTNFPREVAEMALAHTVSDKVEAAYRRGDLLQKRRQLMEAWARFCAEPSAGAGGAVSLQRVAR